MRIHVKPRPLPKHVKRSYLCFIASNEAPIRTHCLSVDPGSVSTGQKRNNTSNVFGLAQSLKRGKL